MDDLIALQENAKGLMQQAFANLKGKAEQISVGQIQARLELLDKRMAEIEDRHKEILSLSANTRGNTKIPYFRNNFLQEVEEIHVDEKAKFLDALHALQSSSKQQERPTASSRKLPNIEIPKFSGKYSDWASFKDLFTSLTINDANLTDVERLQYLKSSLSGEAANLVKGICVTAENYQRVWEKLTSFYDNKRVLIHECLNDLFNLKSMTFESHTTLKQLRDGTAEAVETLEMLKRPVNGMEDFLVFITTQKFDSATRRDWELSLDSGSSPVTWIQLDKFMTSRIQALERSEMKQPPNEIQKNKLQAIKKLKISSHVVAKVKVGCSCCQGDHYIAGCDQFRSFSAEKRLNLVIDKQLCFNCLGSHLKRECRSKKRCITCQGRHHTLLHRAQEDMKNSSSSTPQDASNISVHTVNKVSHQPFQVRLATAVVIGFSEKRQPVAIRALVDPCSEVSFVAESLAQRLMLPRKSTFVPISGVGGVSSQTVRSKVTLVISPYFSSSSTWRLTALVLPKLTQYLPSRFLVNSDLSFMEGLRLADPHPDTGEPIEMILGADIFAQVIEDGLRKSRDEQLVAQATGIGWILTGSLSSNDQHQSPHAVANPVTSLQCIVDKDLSTQIERFWIQEEVIPHVSTMLTMEEVECEEHFLLTHKRSEDGRYILRLPFKKSTQTLGNSKQSALAMLYRMESRFKSKPEFQKSYTEFLSEYEELGHMKRVPSENFAQPGKSFYLPHHGVVKLTDGKHKIRVVFNGSVQLNNGHNINDLLHVGPKLQTDIFDVILRWRMYRFAFSADIQKMFRQIQIDPADQVYQSILWRASVDQDVCSYHLTTVTYGLASSPYQAVRTLHQLASDENSRFPRASRLLKENTYVDDILAGADTLVEACDLKSELIELLMAGGFPLGKWSANHPLLLSDIQRGEVSDAYQHTWQQFEEVQALGISWQPTADVFFFRFDGLNSTKQFTKRRCLSFIAQLYDPMGWITPVTIGFKIFMQSLWHSGLQWDDALPPQMLHTWSLLMASIEHLDRCSIPRWMGFLKSTQLLEFRCFSDASELAYAACVYLRSVSEEGIAQAILISSKSKVAPLKVVSLPRLELCGAVLLARLVKRIQSILCLQDIACHCWMDSTIALSWIQKHPSTWKTFVANRVSEIQVSLNHASWHHITGDRNPADLATRGKSSQEVAESILWRFGPACLTNSSSAWDTSSNFQNLDHCPETRTTACLTSITTYEGFDLLNRYSSLQKLLRITARCFQFIRRKRYPQSIVGEVTPSRLNEALLFWVKHVQNLHFSEELKYLVLQNPVPPRGILRRLKPFVDDQGILRVGGRLKHSILHSDEMNPIVIPSRSYLTKLLIWDAHARNLHGGTQLTLSHLRQRFWILRGRQVVKSVIYQCMRCWRQRASPSTQLMGDLPARRVRPSRPFLHSGVDFAGPINLRLSKGRGTKRYKGYIVVFVCLSTRAVHLEVASGYSTEDFLQAYRRFVARRGICSSISSDCGTNFIGADKELRNLFKQASKQGEEIAHILSNDGTEWRFNPPSAPHFGGIWEAAVKSVKMHLKRVIGETLLTFEEMYTLITQIEACLNSRPLQPISDDPSDLTALTPAHFLIGTSTLTVPEPSTLDTSSNRLSRWRLLRQMYKHFWSRWSSEYLPELQQRRKWCSRQRLVKVGDLCLVRSNQYPPCKWPLARVVDVKPGSDGLVRVVHLKTSNSTLVRPITKISVLPLAQEDYSPGAGEGGRDVTKRRR